jgi:hypothetical protein
MELGANVSAVLSGRILVGVLPDTTCLANIRLCLRHELFCGYLRHEAGAMCYPQNHGQLTTNVFRHIRRRVFGETPRIPLQMFLSDDAQFDRQYIF